MKIERIRLKNYKAFKDVTLVDVPSFCVLVGANGVGNATGVGLAGLQNQQTTDVLMKGE